jgi:hypothetical protein
MVRGARTRPVQTDPVSLVLVRGRLSIRLRRTWVLGVYCVNVIPALLRSPLMPAVRFARYDMLRDVLSIPPDAEENVGRQSVLEEQSHEVQARFSDHDPAFVQGTSVLAEDGEVDSGELLPETRAPDHVRHVQDVSIF